MDKDAIKELVMYLKQSLIDSGLTIESIAMFGSALSGFIQGDSDIDLILISSDFANKDIFERAKMTMKSETATLRKFKIPMDIINLSPEEYESSNIRKFYNPRIVA